MGIFDWILGKKHKKPEAPKVGAEKRPSTTSTRAPRSIDEFAQQACKSKNTISTQMREIYRLTDILKDSLQKEYPDLESGEVFSQAQSGLTLRCPNCGQLGEQVVSYLYLAGAGTMQGAVFGGPDVAALAQGQCPGCGGTSVVATFDPAKIKAREDALTKQGVETEQVLVFKPTRSHPYLSSLSISRDEDKIAWVSGGESGKFEIILYSTTSASEIFRFTHPSPRYSPRCLFVGNDRLLVISRLKNYLADKTDEVRLTLFDVQDGRKVTETDIDDCTFSNPCVRHNTKTIAAEKDMDTLLFVEAEGDNLTYRTIKTSQIYSPGPRFGPDGKVYVIVHYALYRIEGDEKVRVMGGDNCICFDSVGKVYCGGGYSDRSGESALHVADLNSGTTFDIPWGQEPIDVIELAGDNHLLIANIVSEIHAGRYPNAVVTLFSVSDRKKKWTIEISDLKPWREPVLLSAPNEQWALIQTGKLLKRISLHDGKAMHAFSKQPKEFIDANWLPSKKIMCLARNPDRDTCGTLELYKIE